MPQHLPPALHDSATQIIANIALFLLFVVCVCFLVLQILVSRVWTLSDGAHSAGGRTNWIQFMVFE